MNTSLGTRHTTPISHIMRKFVGLEESGSPESGGRNASNKATDLESAIKNGVGSKDETEWGADDEPKSIITDSGSGSKSESGAKNHEHR